MGVLFKRDEGRLTNQSTIVQMRGCENIDDCFVHLVRRRYGSFIAFVVQNEQEKKTFACILYDVQKNTVHLFRKY